MISRVIASGNKLAGFFGYFNHHPNLTTLNLAHTECCGKSSLYTIDEKGKVRPEIRKGSKFDVEDQFMIQPKYYIKTNTEKDRRRRLFTNCLKVGAANFNSIIVSFMESDYFLEFVWMWFIWTSYNDDTQSIDR